MHMWIQREKVIMYFLETYIYIYWKTWQGPKEEGSQKCQIMDEVINGQPLCPNLMPKVSFCKKISNYGRL